MATRRTPRTVAPKSDVKSDSKIPKLTPKNLIIPAIILGVVLLIGIFRNQFVVANVNGEQISRIEFIQNLEKTQGQTTLQNLIAEKLVRQEAKKKNISVTDEELNQEISNVEKTIKDQGQTLDALLTQRNMNRDDLRKQLTVQLLLKKLIGNQEPNEKEIDQYIEQNKQFIPEATDEAQLKTQREQIKQQLTQQKGDQKIQELIQQLQSKAKIDYLLIKPAGI